MKGMRHVVDVLRPFAENDSRGSIDPQNGDKYLSGIPCSIEQLTSREQEAARQVYGFATHRVMMYAKPDAPITHVMWLQWGKRRLDIGEAILDDRGLKYTLTCGEVVA